MTAPAIAPPNSSRSRTPPARGWTQWLVPEVRWAAIAVLLFALGAALQLAGTPAAVWWACYLLCYAAGGWEPGLAGLQA
ncbi:MAG TPA: heavy metal translocating P-type ATPase, partial [Jatrophihabitans sp.]|nr:heavy metal translocating P-type ATPase [Jatrophihabitans sp.]